MNLVRKFYGVAMALMGLPLVSFAEHGEAAASGSSSALWMFPAAGFAIGLAALGAALGQGKIGAAFMEGASRNPSAVSAMRTPLILSLVFVETLVLFTILICLMILGKV